MTTAGGRTAKVRSSRRRPQLSQDQPFGIMPSAFLLMGVVALLVYLIWDEPRQEDNERPPAPTTLTAAP